jgi:hypothetical protein
VNSFAPLIRVAADRYDSTPYAHIGALANWPELQFTRCAMTANLQCGIIYFLGRHYNAAA